jgi:hypothetical protein
MSRYIAIVFLAAFAVASTPARADEGMWTFDHFPAAKVRAAYGFGPSQAWLDHVRLASARLPGCSSSFVSPQGLLMTNHHCAVGCLAALSRQGQDYVKTGFYAKTAADEVRCPGVRLIQLIGISDVTSAVAAATAGKSGRALLDARRAKTLALQASCGPRSGPIECNVVSLYHGGVYDLYRYQRYEDVRIVFAPEFNVAQFGGDPDNFNFPRYDFDLTFLRVYADDKPIATPQYLHWSKNGATVGQLVFVSGHPGGTRRELTVSQLGYVRDVELPRRIASTAEYRGILERYQTEGAEQLRQTNETLFFLENTFKELLGEQQALMDPAFFGTKVAQENALRAAVAKNPRLTAAYGSAWDALAKAETRKAQLAYNEQYVAGGPNSRLFGFARTLVRISIERAKPEADRLPGFDDAALALTTRRLSSPAPTYAGPEELSLAYWAKRLREDLGPDHPYVKKVLGNASPAQWAHALVAGTQLGDPAARTALLKGGQAAIDASTDTMIRFAVAIDADARAAQRRYEDEVTAPESKASELVAKARFAVLGTSIDPDATFSLRLSYGTVKGFPDANGTFVAPFTTIAGLYDRATGAEPYALPQSWLDAKSALTLTTPMNLATDNDIIGGNSGSPMIDKDANVVGLVFDGNIFSLGGDFGFDPQRNRTVAVDSRALLAGLRTVYHADRLLQEITP